MKRELPVAVLALAALANAQTQVPPVISYLSPSSTPAGSQSFAFRVFGSNFRAPAMNCSTPLPQSLILWNGVEQSSTQYSAGDVSSYLTTTIPSTYVAAAGTALVQVRNRSCYPSELTYACVCTNIGDSAAVNFQITQPLTASCNNPPTAVAGQLYTHRLTASGGTGSQYYWMPKSIASGVTLSSNGTISGIFQASDGPTVNFTAEVMDSTEHSVTISCQITVASAPTISAYSPTGATACGPGFALSVAGTGFVSGTLLGIGTAGNYSALSTSYVSVSAITATVPASQIATAGTVNIAAGNPVAGASIAAQYAWSEPRPMVIRQTPRVQSVTPSRATVGAADLQATLAGSNFVSGVTRVLWQAGSVSEALPVTRMSTAEIGVAIPSRLFATAGTARIRVVNVETANPNGEPYSDTCSPPVTFTVEATALQITTSQLPTGRVNVDYRATVAASGGTAPYRFTLTSGSVPGLTLSSADGVLSGRPTQAGSYTLRIQAADSSSTQQTAQRDFTLVIEAATLTITTSQLPAGKVNVDYRASIAASGGTSPYRFTLTSGSVPGLTLSSDGVLSGRPTQAGSYALRIQAADSSSTQQTVQGEFTILVAAADLAIAGPAELASAVVGTPYSVTFTASGGVAPYRWNLESGEVAGLSLSVEGTLSGTPTREGSFTLVVRAADANSLQATRSYSLTVRLPAASATLTAATTANQTSLTLSLGAAYPTDITGLLRLTFAPDAAGLPVSGYVDPALQFASGGRTLSFTVPANSINVTLAQSGAVQLGTVAGTATITLDQLRTASTNSDVPLPNRPSATIVVQRQAPMIVAGSVQISGMTASGFAVELDGYSTPRDLRSATFIFSAASGTQLAGQTSHTVQLSTDSATWFSSTDGRDNGSRFHLRVPFTLSGSSGVVASVSVTLENSVGTSTAVSGGVR